MTDENKPAAPSSENTDEPRMVECVKIQASRPGLKKPPIKGPLGERIFESVSQDGWRMWLEHSKMLINEFRLDLMSEHGQRVWMSELEKYFWGEGSAKPPEFVEEGAAAPSGQQAPGPEGAETQSGPSES